MWLQATACSAGGSTTPTPAAVEQAVSREILAPAHELPVVDLCVATLQNIVSGRVRPLLCRDGGVNELAWRFYAPSSDSLFRLPADADQVLEEGAVCDDLDHNHATRPQEADAFELVSAYHGWHFLVDTAHDPCL